MNVKVLHLVDEELRFQDGKWGADRHLDDRTWITILGEEFGEVCHASLEHDSDNLIEELVDVAAVAVAFLTDRLNSSRLIVDTLTGWTPSFELSLGPHLTLIITRSETEEQWFWRAEDGADITIARGEKPYDDPVAAQMAAMLWANTHRS